MSEQWTRKSVLAIASNYIGADAISDAVADAHNAALAAERQRREQEIRELTTDNWRYCEELRSQLVSALAAIEKHNKSGYGGDYPINVDLSLLHQHDAEVRKPLVEAMKSIKELTTTPERSFSKIYDLVRRNVAQPDTNEK